MASAERPTTRINRSVAAVPDCGDHTTAIAQTRSHTGMTVLRVMRMAMRGLFLLPGLGLRLDALSVRYTRRGDTGVHNSTDLWNRLHEQSLALGAASRRGFLRSELTRSAGRQLIRPAPTV